MNWAFIKWHKWSDEITEEARNYLQSLLMHIKLLAWYLFVFLLINSTNLVWVVEKVSFHLLIPRIVVLFVFVLFVLIRWSWPQADDASKLTSCASFLAGLTITVEIERSLMSCDFAHLVQWTWFSVPDGQSVWKTIKETSELLAGFSHRMRTSQGMFTVGEGARGSTFVYLLPRVYGLVSGGAHAEGGNKTWLTRHGDGNVEI